MNSRRTKSERALVQMLIVLTVSMAAVAAAVAWRWELVRNVYLIDSKTIILNGFILLIFISGVLHLIRDYVHCRFEEKLRGRCGR